MSENCLIMYYERLEQYSGVFCNNSGNLPIGLTIHNEHCSYNSHSFQNNTKPCLIVNYWDKSISYSGSLDLKGSGCGPAA